MIKILVIDDNQDNLISLKALVKESFPEATLVTATNGNQGIEQARHEDPDVILLDMLMPGMDGYDVCQQLKVDPALRDIPVVFLTALKGDKECSIRALECGAEAFLTKPIDEIEFTVQIRAMLKIKSSNLQKRDEQKRLSKQVTERTLELEKNQAETLKLLDELSAENEFRKKIETELRESEEKYRLLHETAGVGIGYYTPDGIVISFNKVAAKNMNGKPEDFRGKSIHNLFQKEDADFYMERIIKAVNSERSQVYEDKVELPTEDKWFHSVFSRIKNAEDKVIGVQIVSSDITQQKNNEAVIKLEEARFESLLKINQYPAKNIQELLDFALEEAITLTESKIGYIYFYDENEQKFSLNTWSKEVMQQCTVTEPQTLYELDKTGIWGEAVRQRRPILVNDFTKANPLKKGIPQGHAPLHKFLTIPVFIEDHIVAVVGVANKPNDYNDSDIRQLKLMMDAIWKIVERKKSEEIIIISEAKFRALFTQMSEGFALHEVIYDEFHKAIDYKILDINPAFEKQVGILAEKANGALATQLYGVTPAPYLDVYSAVAETGERQSFLTYFPPFDRHFQISAFSPNPGYFATIFTDITDRMKAEESLKNNEARLRELNATKDKFFSIIAHDLKSPFNSILGLSEQLVEQTLNHDYEGIEEYANIIQNSSKRAMDLLLNLLEWSRSQTGRMEFNPEYIELVSLINEVVELANAPAMQKTITITKELPSKVIAYADKSMISAILRNLLSNAIKFTRPGGMIKISVNKNKTELQVCVNDNGVGISPGDINKLFRIDENHTTLGTQNEKGTGLGLILCKEFIEKHNGQIWIESKTGVGSQFYFTIPNH